MKPVIGKILFNYVSLVATADNKFGYPMGTENLQDMPEDWLASDFYHWLGLQMVSSLIRVPKPPARMTAFIEFFC